MVGGQRADEHHLLALLVEMKGEILPECTRALDGEDEFGVDLDAFSDAPGQRLGEAGVVRPKGEAASSGGAVGIEYNSLVLVFCRVDADNGFAADAVPVLLHLFCPFHGLYLHGMVIPRSGTPLGVVAFNQ